MRFLNRVIVAKGHIGPKPQMALLWSFSFSSLPTAAVATACWHSTRFRSIDDIVKTYLGSALPIDDDTAALATLLSAMMKVKSEEEHRRLADAARIIEAKVASKAKAISVLSHEHGGKFPATCAPPTPSPGAAAPATPLSFIIPSTTDGPWCFEPTVTQRIIRNYEYPLLWQRLEDMRSDQNPMKGMVIMGHPGIGKTLLLDTLLSWNLHAYPTQPVIVIAV
eukprot:PhM_4_TR18626/c2_g1_i1/m.27294